MDIRIYNSVSHRVRIIPIELTRPRPLPGHPECPLARLAGRVGLKALANERFGRDPCEAGLSAFVARIGYRLALRIGAQGLARACDDGIWRYQLPHKDGIWLRCLLQKQVGG